MKRRQADLASYRQWISLQYETDAYALENPFLKWLKLENLTIIAIDWRVREVRRREGEKVHILADASMRPFEETATSQMCLVL